MKLATKEFPSSEKRRKRAGGGERQVAGEVIGKKKGKRKKSRKVGAEGMREGFFFLNGIQWQVLMVRRGERGEPQCLQLQKRM